MAHGSAAGVAFQLHIVSVSKKRWVQSASEVAKRIPHRIEDDSQAVQVNSVGPKARQENIAADISTTIRQILFSTTQKQKTGCSHTRKTGKKMEQKENVPSTSKRTMS